MPGAVDGGGFLACLGDVEAVGVGTMRRYTRQKDGGILRWTGGRLAT